MRAVIGRLRREWALPIGVATTLAFPAAVRGLQYLVLIVEK
ncbi:MAG TPA: hypothetical protein VKV24_20770 [Casimicrobiaceae bacterium]|nr:hypothetical protein [Casimicrobiaceae bacterium]